MRFLLILLMLCIASCTQDKPLDAQQIVDKAIATAGGSTLQQSKIQFKFRDYFYNATRTEKGTRYERCTEPTCTAQRDVLENGDFTRFRKSIPTPLPDSMAHRYGNSVNSVHYFAALPYGLNDKAVSKELLDEAIVKNEPYYRIKVTFSQEGGGDDFEDQYLYWIHKTRFTVDYLAYNYQTNEGGTRFRAAYNPRVVNGIRFVDYDNYKTEEQFPPLTSLDSLYENNHLQLLSKIELENVQVEACLEC